MNEDNIVTVIHGPSVWIGRTGEVLSEDGEFIVVELFDKDDGRDGVRPYHVRMPRACTIKGQKPVAKA